MNLPQVQEIITYQAICPKSLTKKRKLNNLRIPKDNKLKENKLITNNPGSGNYEYKKDSIYKNEKKYSMGKKLPIKYMENFDTLGKFLN